MAAAAAAADQTKLRKRLEALLKLPDNLICADCKKRGPRWASANLGIFVCIECSGIHRNLGVHISFVRSVNLDSWTKVQVDRMEEWGNGRANELYEASVPSQVHRPKEGDSVRIVEKFIRDKYEHKRYMAKSIPPKVERTETVEDDDDDVPKRRTTRPRPVPAVQVATSVPVARAPAPAPASVPVPVAAPQVSLIDFMEPIIEPTPVPAPTPVAQQSFDAFGPSGNFGFAQTPAQQFQQSSVDAFSPFATAPAPTPVTAVPPAKPQASTDAILSLYGGGGSGGAGGGYPAPQPGYGAPAAQGGWGGPPASAAIGAMMPQPPMMGGYAGMPPGPGGMPGYPPPPQPHMGHMGGYGMTPMGGMGGLGGPHHHYPGQAQPQGYAMGGIGTGGGMMYGGGAPQPGMGGMGMGGIGGYHGGQQAVYGQQPHQHQQQQPQQQQQQQQQQNPFAGLGSFPSPQGGAGQYQQYGQR